MSSLQKAIKRFVKRLQVHHYIVAAIVLGSGIFNAVTALSPVISQKELESNIEKSFEKWWAEEGAAQFRTVGLTDDDKTKLQEFVQYRDRILSAGKTFDIEERTKAMRKEFREWWEIGGGKEQFVQEQGFYPKEAHFEKECHKYIKKFTDKFVRYRFAFVPKDGEYDRLFTSALLSPSAWSFIIFAVFFLFAYIKLADRWGVPITLGTFLAFIALGGLLADMLTSTSFFKQFAMERYMGASVALAFMLGAAAFDERKDSIPTGVRAFAVAGLLLDLTVNVLVNGGIYAAVAAASAPAFGLGALAGIKIPRRRRSEAEKKADALEERFRRAATRNLAAERKQKMRSQMDEGFQEAKKGHYDAARQLLCQAMTAVLQEQPADREFTAKFAERLTNPNLFIDVASTQWLEWGDTAKARGLTETALLLLEKGLKSEKNETLARRALFNIGELRVNFGIEPEEGIKRLQKVIELNDSDLIAKQAKRLLEKAGV